MTDASRPERPPVSGRRPGRARRRRGHRARGAPERGRAAAADGVFVVADGMGGHEAGEVASRTAVDALRALGQGVPDQADVRARCARRARARARTARRRGRGGPGTTATGVVLTVHGGTPCWLVLNVGDSRTYRMAGGVLEQVTRTTPRSRSCRAGLVPADEAAGTRAATWSPGCWAAGRGVEPDVWLLPVSPATGCSCAPTG